MSRARQAQLARRNPGMYAYESLDYEATDVPCGSCAYKGRLKNVQRH